MRQGRLAACQSEDRTLSAHNHVVPSWKISIFDDLDDGPQAQLLRICQDFRSSFFVSDNRTMVYSPVPRNVEAGSTSVEKPNALVIEGAVAETLAHATDLAGTRTEVGQTALTPERVDATVSNLKADPPQPFDLSRKLKVSRSEVQFVELKMTNATFRSRRIRLPVKFQKLDDEDLRSRISSTLKVPVDLEIELEISIQTDSRPEKLKVNDRYIMRLRRELERVFFQTGRATGR